MEKQFHPIEGENELFLAAMPAFPDPEGTGCSGISVRAYFMGQALTGAAGWELSLRHEEMTVEKALRIADLAIEALCAPDMVPLKYKDQYRELRGEITTVKPELARIDKLKAMIEKAIGAALDRSYEGDLSKILIDLDSEFTEYCVDDEA